MISRLVQRAPLLLYRARLGWLLGERFLRLAHRGRRSGRRRETVLETIGRDEDRALYVVSGRGERSDWLRNLMVEPRATIDTGRRRGLAVTARRLEPAEAVEPLRGYMTAHRRTAEALGSRLDVGSADGATPQQLAEAVPVIELAYVGTERDRS